MTVTRLAAAPTTTKGVYIMATKAKLDSEIKVRCNSDEKENLKKRAKEVRLGMSDYVRSLIFGNEKLVLLSEGSEIAKALFLIHTDLEYFRNNGGIPEESLRAITESLDDVAAKLNAVSEKLTDIHAESEEADSDE